MWIITTKGFDIDLLDLTERKRWVKLSLEFDLSVEFTEQDI